MRKDDYIKTIIVYIRSKNGIDYQLAIRDILFCYYKSLGKTYDMPNPAGGDYKNDGWCKEDATFYQIFSPEQISKSFISDVFSKFDEDFEGLAKHVYLEKLWGGKINEFIFLVNSRGAGSPKDPSDKVGVEKTKIEDLYSVKIQRVSIVDDEFIKDILNCLENSQLQGLITMMGLSGCLGINSIAPLDVCNFFSLFSEAKLGELISEKTNSNYKRISTDEKIQINDLSSHYNRIQDFLAYLSVVDKALCIAKQNIESFRVFEKLKDLFISNYQLLKNTYHGDELYNELLNSILKLGTSFSQNALCAELVMIYIFDRCDIFEKEISNV